MIASGAVATAVTNDEANDLADDILSRDEFVAAQDPGLLERGVNRVLREIAEFLADLFSVFGGAGGGAGAVLAYVLLGLAALVLVAAIVKAVRGWTPKTDDEEQPGARIVFDEVVEPDALRQQMASHRAAGQWRETVIAGFRLAVLELIDSGIAREVSGATTGDFGRAVERSKPETLPAYQRGASSFERAFYSDLEVDETDVAAIDALLAELASVGAR